jgi:hypothetical protein
MKRIIFYIWQSDLGSANRNFIQRALEDAAKAIKTDDTLDIEPIIDRDTAGVPGSPEIAKTIFEKIADADVVVADVSIINRESGGRPSPNPNVLIEAGYALSAIGHERIILVFNTAFGKVEDLPFDLRPRRVTKYHIPQDAADRSAERKKLQRSLEEALKAILPGIKEKQIEEAETRLAIAKAIDAEFDLLKKLTEASVGIKRDSIGRLVMIPLREGTDLTKALATMQEPEPPVDSADDAERPADQRRSIRGR